MAQLWYNDAATWRKAKEFYYNDAGTWRRAKECWYNDGGTWRRVFVGFTTVASPVDFNGSNTDIGGSVTIRFNSEGTVDATIDASLDPAGNWGTPTTTGAGSDYWIKFFAKSSGTGTISSPALPTGWVSLSSAQSITMTGPPAHTARNAVVPYQISTDSGGVTVVLSGNLNFASNLL